jgi:hypothetical protein
MLRSDLRNRQRNRSAPEMSQQKDANSENSTRIEAERLAKEGLEEIKAGDKEDGRFVLEEARKLDPGAVDAVLKQEKSQGGASRKG